jgi:hypothetical protein
MKTKLIESISFIIILMTIGIMFASCSLLHYNAPDLSRKQIENMMVFSALDLYSVGTTQNGDESTENGNGGTFESMKRDTASIPMMPIQH